MRLLDDLFEMSDVARDDILIFFGIFHDRLKDKQLSVMLTDSARQYIIDGGYDPVYGARPLKRFMQAKIETLLARKMIAEDIAPGTKITIDYITESSGESKLVAVV